MNTVLPTLYYRADCPFCWKVRIALVELDIKYRSIETQLGEKHPDVQRLNPKGSVPVFVDGDTTIWESSVIIEYLLDGPRQSQLLPGTPENRSTARLLHSYSDSVVGPALRGLVFEKRAKPETDWNIETIQKSEQAWEQCQEQLAQWLGDKEYFCDQFSIAECALLARFGIAEFYDAQIPNQMQNLKRWYQNGRQRPSFQSTFPAAFT